MSISKHKKLTSAIQKEMGIPVSILQSKLRTQQVVFARMVFTQILTTKHKLTERQIAVMLNVDRTMIYHYLEKFQDECKYNRVFLECYQRVVRAIEQKAIATTPPEDVRFLENCDSRFGIDLIKEHKFYPTRRWRFDFAIPEMKIAIEKEGGIWNNGRHTRAAGFIADMEKYNAAGSLGWIVLRATPQNINSAEFLELLETTINMRKKNSVIV